MKFLNQKLKRARPLLGTFVEVELSGPVPTAWLQTWITKGFEAIAEIDRLMSRYRADSDLSRINRAEAGDWVEVHALTVQVLRASNQLWKSSNGVFDIRCATPSPLMGEGWDGSERRPPP